MISLLVTQCLQRDFVDPIRALDPRRGLQAEDAIAAVWRPRGPRAVETREQERFVRAFAGRQS